MQCSPMTCILFSGCGDAIKPETAPISRKPVVTHPSVERSRKDHDWFSLQFWGDGVRRHQQRSPWLPGQYTSTDNSAVAAGELFTHERDWDVRGNPNIEKTAKPDSGGWDRLRPH